jgi:sec-independent protein translocase protein TatA
MDFFGIGFGELILILLLALIIWGPRRIPEIARNLGKTMPHHREEKGRG